MRLPFPERIPLPLAIFAASVLFALQQFQQTSLAFSLYSFLFVVIATIAFNVAGGFTRPSGSYIFFYALLGVILGLVFKAFLGEPADSNLRAPLLTIQVHTGAITAMLGAAILSRKLTRRKPFLENVLKEKDVRNATLGALAVGCVLFFLTIVVTHQAGSVLTAITQINRFLPLAIILATLHAITSSRGRKSYDGLLAFALGISVLIGFVNFGKEAMFTPLICWLVAAASLRYKLRLTEVVAIVVIGVFYVMYLVPYSQYGRNFIPEDGNFATRTAVAFSLLGNLSEVREQYQLQQQQTFQDAGVAGYYNNPEGFADRLTMIPFDDMLINYTEQGHVAGYAQIGIDLANWVPHFIWPNKPSSGGGNLYAREIGGIISEEDTSTGISFSPAGQAYHLDRWVGIFVLAPVIWTVLFVIFDSLCGDSRRSPWGLLMIALFAHTAPEGMLSGAIYMMWYGSIAIIVTALSSSYLLPIIGTLVAGPEKTGVVQVRPFIRRRVAPIQPSDVIR